MFGGTLWGGGTGNSNSGSSTAVQFLGLLDEALRYAGVVTGPGRTPSTDQRNDAFVAARRMMDGWKAQRLKFLTLDRLEFDLVADQDSYTIGVDADEVDWEANRPAKIESAGLVIDGNESPIEVLTEGRWAAIADREATGTVAAIFYKPTVPYGTLYPYPISASADSLALYVWGSVETLTDYNVFIDLAPGYEDAIVFPLAVRIWMKNTARSILTPQQVSELKSQAREAVAVIESRNNPRPPRMKSDYPGDCSSFDIRTRMFR